MYANMQRLQRCVQLKEVSIGRSDETSSLESWRATRTSDQVKAQNMVVTVTCTCTWVHFMGLYVYYLAGQESEKAEAEAQGEQRSCTKLMTRAGVKNIVRTRAKFIT
jgi:hypothetical protein